MKLLFLEMDYTVRTSDGHWVRYHLLNERYNRVMTLLKSSILFALAFTTQASANTFEDYQSLLK